MRQFLNHVREHSPIANVTVSSLGRSFEGRSTPYVLVGTMAMMFTFGSELLYQQFAHVNGSKSKGKYDDCLKKKNRTEGVWWFFYLVVLNINGVCRFQHQCINFKFH